MNEFIEYLRPMTIIGQIDAWRRVPFNVRMGSMTGGTTGYWVGQGKPIPVSKGTTSSTSLGITKAAGIAVSDMKGYPNRFAGRGGLGAVMGSKGLKAIVVSDKGLPYTEHADKEAFQAALKRFASAAPSICPARSRSYPRPWS
jgi:hypothetical protein